MTIGNLTRVLKNEAEVIIVFCARNSSNRKPYQSQKTVATISPVDERSLNFNSIGSSTVFHIMNAFFCIGSQ